MLIFKNKGSAVLCGGLAMGFALATGEVLAERPWVIENEDNDHYFYGDASKATKASLEAYVDTLLEGGYVTHIFWCVNGQRPNYDSKVCEPIWAALEDSEVQWGYCSKDWPTNAKLMHDAGIDPYAVWIARTRELGASPWVSVRMNDNHDGWLPHGARVADFYKKHPEWRMMPDYRGGQWWPYALDFAHPEVRDYTLALVREIAGRYDADGIELDFLRCETYLHDGSRNAPIMTEFIRKCRECVETAGKRRNRKMLLAIRVEPTVALALEHGFDVVEIAKSGLVDVVIPCNSSPAQHWDIPVDEWKRLIHAVAPQVRVVAGTTAGYGGKGRWHDAASLRAWAASMLAAGVGDLYFFNLHWSREDVRRAIHPGACTSPENTKKGPRSFLVDSVGASFPASLAEHRVFHRRLPNEVKADASVSVLLGLSGGQDLPALVLLNGVKALSISASSPATGREALCTFPISAIKGGDNEIILEPVVNSRTKVDWVALGLDL